MVLTDLYFMLNPPWCRGISGISVITEIRFQRKLYPYFLRKSSRFFTFFRIVYEFEGRKEDALRHASLGLAFASLGKLACARTVFFTASAIGKGKKKLRLGKLACARTIFFTTSAIGKGKYGKSAIKRERQGCGR
jgi:hypothetical protein